MSKDIEELVLSFLNENCLKISIPELSKQFQVSEEVIISVIKSLQADGKITGTLFEDDKIFLKVSWDDLMSFETVKSLGICPLSISEKLGISPDDLLKYIIAYSNEHSINALRVPGKEIVIFPDTLKGQISKKGVISLSELVENAGISKEDARYVINTLIVTGFRGIYVDETFVTLDFLMDKVEKILRENGSVGVSALARMLDVDEKVAFNLLIELKRFKVNPNLKIG